MSAFWQALLSAQQAPAAPASVPIGPLRTLRFDDTDASFFTYAGSWSPANGGWPGGSYLNTVTFRAAVVPSEPTPTFTTKVIPFMGQPDEGIILWGASEDGGPFQFFIRALDSKTNSGWVQFVGSVGTGTYRYDWRTTNVATDPPEEYACYNNSNLGQSYYDRLGNPGVLHLFGMPAGRYQFMVQKPANATDPNDNGNKAFYFDGATVYTRHPTFS